MQSGEHVDKVADMFGVGRRTLYEWARKYREGGSQGMAEVPRSGRPKKLSDHDVLSLSRILTDSSPSDHGLSGKLWTRRHVQEVIRTELGAHVSRVTVSRALEKLEINGRLPLCSAFQDSSADMRMWEDSVFPAIKLRADRKDSEILFLDEMRADIPGGAGRGTIYSTLTLQGAQSFSVTSAEPHPSGLASFLYDLVSDSSGNLTLVASVSALHTSSAVAEFVTDQRGRVDFHLFPDYSINSWFQG